MKAVLACLLFCGTLWTIGQATNVTAPLPNKEPAFVSPRCEAGEYFVFPNTKGSIYNPAYQEKREYFTITFKEAFYSLPFVSVSFSKLDIDRVENVRTHVVTTNIVLSGFTAYVNQWSGAIVHEAKVSWIACAF